MAYRKVICLAFSRRDGGHCFAGIDLSTGKWMRPVPTPEGGTLYYHQCLVRAEGKSLLEPRLLDIVDIDFVSHSPKVCQPENWLIGSAEWRLSGRATKADVAPYISADPELFRGYDRFVSAGDVAARPPANSLVLVTPQRLSWHARISPRGTRQIIGTFSIAGQSYTLPLTDEAHEKQLGDLPTGETRWHDPAVPILLTISLGDLYEITGRHYKLIAGVILQDS
jgi:hypothetical protein